MAAVTGDSRVIQTQFEHPRLTRPAPEEAGALVLFSVCASGWRQDRLSRCSQAKVLPSPY